MGEQIGIRVQDQFGGVSLASGAGGDLLTQLRHQVAAFLDYATDAALQPLLSADLPFVGNVLTGLVTDALLAPLKQAIDDALDTVDAASTTLEQDMVDAINAIGGGVSAVLVPDRIRIAFDIADTLAVATDPFAIDVGFDALGFELQGGVSGSLAYALKAGLVFNTTNGILGVVNVPGDVLKLTLEGSLDDLQGEGSLGFLTVGVTDEVATPEIQLSAGVDIAGGRVDQLNADSLSARINGAANLRFGLAASLDGAEPGAPSPLPRIFTDLVASYAITDFDPATGLSGLGATPTIALEDIELDVGTLVQWLGEVLSPITDTLFGAFALDELFDALTAPIPLIDGGVKAIGLFDLVNIIDDSRINLLDLAAYASPDSKPVIEAFSKAYNLIKGIAELADDEGLGGGGRINFGDRVLVGDAPEGFAPLATGDYLGQLKDVLDDIGAPSTDGLANDGGTLSGLLDESGFEIPLLENPEAIVGILLNGLGGAPIDLVRYDIPRLGFDAGFSQFFPIIGPIGVSLSGQFGAGIDLKVGYDTAGFQTGNLLDGIFVTTQELASPRVVGGLSDPTTVYFESAASIEAEIAASAGVNIGIAEISIGGGVFAGLDVYFEGATTEGDGKLRLSDLSGCVFDPIVGEFGVKVLVTFRVGIGPFSYTKRFDIVKVVLADFTFGCEPETDPNQGLASLAPTGILTLNAGDRAGERIIEGKVGKDIDETYVLTRKVGGAVGVAAFGIEEINGHPGGGETADDTRLVTLIVGHMGDEDDQVAIDIDVITAAQLWGDDGNDLLQGGARADIIRGGDDDDRLIGQGGNDRLEGEDGDDVLEGGKGADIIDGGDGFDQVTYENSTVGVTFRVSADDDDIFVGTGGEAAGDRVTDVEHVIGSHFSDRLYGDPDDGGILEGLDGDDALVGGEDDDLLLGGGGADNLRGQDGDDTISFVTSSGQVSANLQSGNGSNGDAEGDRYISIENVFGSNYDDVLTGNGSDNRLDGWNGDDILTGGGGEDEIDGGGGDDLIYGSADGGVLNGGGSINAPGKDTLSYAKVGAGVEIDLQEGDGDDATTRAFLAIGGLDLPQAKYSTFEDLIGSDFNDVLRGDWQNNRVEGGFGNDNIDGSEGDDVVIGGVGADFIFGGGGRDLADYSASTAGVTVDLFAPVQSGGHAAGDRVFTIEDLTGSRFVDTLRGNDSANRISPGLSGSSSAADAVDGRGGTDTLVLNYGERDVGRGLTGGYDLNSTTMGSFQRLNSSGSATLDRVTFSGIDRVEVIGTTNSDSVLAGGGDDYIQTDDGADFIFTGQGFDRVFAGAGDDLVLIGTSAARQFTSIRETNFGDIRGGAGIDSYGLSLADATNNLVLAGTDGTTEFQGTNFSNGTGSAISEFEVLAAVTTGSGDDQVSQPGLFFSSFSTGFGVDVITPGGGLNVINGGQDFRLGTEVRSVVSSGTDRTTLEVIGATYEAVFRNAGDLLQLDYRGAAQGIASVVTQVDTSHDLVRTGSNERVGVFTNTGSYRAGTSYSTSFNGIERVQIDGTQFADEIVGTDLTYGLNVVVAGQRGRPGASLSARGDDILNGHAGSDTIIGGSGDDAIDGGAGDDVIYGTEYFPGREQPQADKGEIDRLTGGTGRDVFVLGNFLHSYYNDDVKSVSGVRSTSTENRAVISDFSRTDDKLVLSSFNLPAPAAGYVSVERNGNTYIYLKDGQTVTGAPAPAANELIAELTGVTGFSLGASYVVYSSVSSTPWMFGNGSAAPNPIPPSAPPPTPGSAPVPPREAGMIATDDPIGADQPTADSIAAMLASVTANTIVPEARVAAASIAATNWITQTSDLQALDAALWGNKKGPFFDGILSIEGYGAGIGTFKGDPFGLGEGVVLSTGRVSRIAGENRIDGGRAPQPTVQLVFEEIASAADGIVYRANLTGLGFDLNSLRLGDSGSGFGGGAGTYSGFDIDAVVLSRTRLDTIDSAAQFNALARVPGLSFNVADTEFTPGSIRPGSPATTVLNNTINGLPNFGVATLDRLDGLSASFTLGDGGSLGLDLTQTVDTDAPLYLYVVEAGGAGETITSGFTASAGRLDAPADLNTDLGLAGGADDVTALTYRFNGRQADQTSTKVAFDFVFFSEEFAEFAQSEFNDKFKIMLNGVNMARTSSGAFASVGTIYAPPAGPTAQSSITSFYTAPLVSDYIANPVGTGPFAGHLRADGLTKVLTFVGDINPGEENEIRIEVSDTGDGFLDSGIFISGKLIASTEGRFEIDQLARPLRENVITFIDYAVDLPEGATLRDDVTVTFRPDRYIDLGAGPGVAIRETLPAADPRSSLAFRVAEDGSLDTNRTDLIQIEVEGLPGTTTVAPLTIEVIDAIAQRRYTVGDASLVYNPDDPNEWALAWSDDGLRITHSANAIARAPVWSAVNFDPIAPTTLPGGDMFRGDLGVSGTSGTPTTIAQDITGTEGLRFKFASDSVLDVTIDFARFEAGDTARIRFFDDAGTVVRALTTNDRTVRVSGLSGVDTMVVSSAAGGFMLDSVSVIEAIGGRSTGVRNQVASVAPMDPEPAASDALAALETAFETAPAEEAMAELIHLMPDAGFWWSGGNNFHLTVSAI